MPQASFREEELAAVERLSAPRLASGVWSDVRRDTGPDEDRILIWLPHREECRYQIVRDRSGWTYVLYCLPNDLRLAALGTMEECLNVFGL